MTTTAHFTIDLNDVIRAGGLRAAMTAECERSDTTSCGVIGPSFSTSGPGSGWSKQHDEDDFAARAFSEGALYYLDLDNGKLIGCEFAEDAERDEDGDLPDDVHTDIGGCQYRIGDWSDESVIELVCPTVEDALEHPAEVAEMAQAVIDYHGPESDCKEWADLIDSIKTAAEALDEIDADKLRETA